MGITIKPSDLRFKYPKVTQTRFHAKFQGDSDPEPFDRDDLYDILPLLEGVMDHLGRDDAETLHLAEEIMVYHLPKFVISRGEVFRFLTGSLREVLADQ